MVAYAGKFGEDESLWAITGLLHDFDWEIHPSAPDHPMKGEAILESRGVSLEIRRAILSHANYSGVPRVSLLERALFACDEVTGFLSACSYVKPGKSIFEVDVQSVKRKLKDKAFARNVNREDIVGGAQELGVPLEEHISFCIEALKSRAADLGLAGTTQSAEARA
jgi:predicted hydrolase (HD superfamily)